MKTNWSNLPVELINKIINYTGVITFYKGKYYNKIQKDDPRYAMLMSIRNPMCIDKCKTIIHLQKHIGESYNTPRFKLFYFDIKNNAGEIMKHMLYIIKHGHGNITAYTFTKEKKWARVMSGPIWHLIDQ